MPIKQFHVPKLLQLARKPINMHIQRGPAKVAKKNRIYFTFKQFQDSNKKIQIYLFKESRSFQFYILRLLIGKKKTI